MATTPLQGFTVPGGIDAPAGNTNFGTFGGEVEKKVVMTYASAAARDSAIILANRVEGMTAYLNDVNLLTMWEGAAWVEVGGKRQRAYTWPRASTDNFSMNGTFVAMTVGGSVANAPAGDWLMNWHIGLSATVAGAGNFRATVNSTNLSGDIPFDLSTSRSVVGWAAPFQLTTVSTLTVSTDFLGTGGGTGSVYAGSRVTASYLGPR